MIAEKMDLRNPFPGLRPFTDSRDDVLVFFGREAKVKDLLSRLQLHRFVAVVGSSGSGKSSLVKAGLLPALHGGFMAGVGSRWRVASMRPENTPVANLIRAFKRCGISIERSTLDQGARGLAEAVKQAALPSDENVLVLVDQFEELFRFAQSGGQAFADEAAFFVKLLLAAAADATTPIYVLITMRSDFIGECAKFRDLPETLNDNLFLVPRLTSAQMREAIEGPVAVRGAAIAPQLVNRLLSDLDDDSDQLPVLQHALMRTWDIWKDERPRLPAVDFSHYETAGTLSGALSLHGDEILRELDAERPGLSALAERVFKALTELGGDNRGIRRPTRFDDLCAITGAPEADVRAVVDAFRKAGRSFLTPPPDPTKPISPSTPIDLSHEALMRAWAKLKQWVEEEAAAAALYRRLLDHAQSREKNPDITIGGQLLASGEEWLENTKPTAAWADRYGGNFAGVAALIAASRAAVREAGLRQERERELAVVERIKEARARRTGLLLRVMSVIALIAIGAGVIALLQTGKAIVFARNEAAARSAAQQSAAAEMQASDRAQLAAMDASIAEVRAEYFKLLADHHAADALDQKAVADRANSQTNVTLNAWKLASFDRSLYNGNGDDRIAGLIGVASFALSQNSPSARDMLLEAGVTPNALQRVALPPWSLGAVTNHGRNVVVLAGERQDRYGQRVSGSLVDISAADLAVLSRTSGISGSFMCGLDGSSQIAVADSGAIDVYDAAAANGPAFVRAEQTGPIQAMACSQSSAVYVDASNRLTSWQTGGADPRSIAHLAHQGVNGIRLSSSGRYAAVTFGSGDADIYDLLSGALLKGGLLYKKYGDDCTSAAGCGGDVVFSPDESYVAWYDSGQVDAEAVAANSDAEKSFPCPRDSNLATYPCMQPFLVWRDGADLPDAISHGGASYDSSAHKYLANFKDRSGAGPQPVLWDSEYQVFMTGYDPTTAEAPNPLGDGLAIESIVGEQGPLVGSVPSQQWIGGYSLFDHYVRLPASSGWITYDLDDLRESASGAQRQVSTEKQIFDCADGRHAVVFDYKTGGVQILEADQVIHSFTWLPIATDKSGDYVDTMQIRYDPQSQVTTMASSSTLVRLSPTGRLLMEMTRSQYAQRAGVASSSVGHWWLSQWGNYVVLTRRSGNDFLMRTSGEVVGSAYIVDQIATDESYALVESLHGNYYGRYTLPHWALTSQVAIPASGSYLATSPDGKYIAYLDTDQKAYYIYDTRARTLYTSNLPVPRAAVNFYGTSFSADNRYLLVDYTTKSGNWIAVYSMDPAYWARAACAMFGGSLSQSEFQLVAPGTRYLDECAPYEQYVYRW